MNKIREARLASGLTQKAMSEIMKIPVRTIGDWETDKHYPPEWAEILVVEKLQQISASKRENEQPST